MDKITIIDGNSLLFRAYYATAYPGVEIMHSEDGTPTNAVFAFSNMINKILLGVKEGEGLFVSFDTGKKTFRHQALETYKANRKPAPVELITQFPIAREFLKSLGVYQFEEEGFEGDDIAGTVATLAKNENIEVHLYTSDRDFLQLVDTNVFVHILKKGLSDVMIMTPELVKETYGFEPKQIIDYKGLRGDSSDNLPGIPGVGEKTAVKLIQDYGSFDNIIEHASEIKGKLGEQIIANKEIGTISRDLAIIQTNIDLPFTINDLEYKGYDFNAINDFCKKYSLKQFINKVTPKWKISSVKSETIEFKETTSLKDVILDKEIGIALDFDDEDYHTPIYGLAISDGKNSYYITYENFKNDKYTLDLLSNPEYKKYCYDYKAIKVGLKAHNIDINGLYFDILIASYLIDSSLKNSPDLVMNIFGVELGEEETISLFSNGNMNRTVRLAYYSRNLFEKVYGELNKLEMTDLYKTLELPLVDTLSDMEIEGFPLDAKTLKEFGEGYKNKLDQISEEIFSLAGETFNISSPKQLGEILFEKLDILNGKRPSSTSFDTLKDLVDKHPIVEKILEYRKYFKLLSTYVDGLVPHIHEDGKIHACFNQALTTTGRLSSSKPNLQNISVRDEEGKQIRKAFYYPEEDIEILSLDYSQIELRILAHLSNCQTLKDIFASGEDIHAATAKKIFHLNSEPTSAQRRLAKTVNFGIVYGISNWGLADELGISSKEAQSIINSFYETFPEVQEFFTNVIAQATKDGYVSTLLGRRRYLRELHDSNYQTREFAKRACMNAPIQGTAADLIKLAMIQVDKKIKEGHFKSKMVLQIHDELIFKVYKDEKEQIYQIAKKTMENALDISVNLQVDGGFGKNWFMVK